MLDSDWLIAKFLKALWLNWINLISARLNRKSILIFSCYKQLVKKFAFFIQFYSFLEVIQLFLSKNLGHSKSPIFSFSTY